MSDIIEGANEVNSSPDENLNEGFDALANPVENQKAGEIINETERSSSGRRRRTKSRVKIKARVRVKKKSSSNKVYKKLLERLVWVAFIAAFITALVILYQQMGINDSKYKSNKRTMLSKPNKQLIECQHSINKNQI